MESDVLWHSSFTMNAMSAQSIYICWIAFDPMALVSRLWRHVLLESALSCHDQVQDLSRARQNVWDRVDTPVLASPVKFTASRFDAFCWPMAEDFGFEWIHSFNVVQDVWEPIGWPRDHDVVTMCHS